MANTIPTIDDFSELYPEFCIEKYSAMIEQQLSLSSRLLSQSAWGNFYSDGIMLDAAHSLFIRIRSQEGNGKGAAQMSAGPVTNVGAAGMSAGFASVQANAIQGTSIDWYNKTAYGQQFLRLRHAVIPMMAISA